MSQKQPLGIYTPISQTKRLAAILQLNSANLHFSEGETLFPRSETLGDVVKHEVPGPGDAPPTSHPAPRLFPLTSNEQRRTLQGIHKGQNRTDQRLPRCRCAINLLKQKSRKVLTARSRPTTSSLFPLPPKPMRQHSGPTVPTNPPTHQHQTMCTMKTTTTESRKKPNKTNKSKHIWV